jgi:pyruvate/2-oxoglutarate dehydrogenase complex dihydrolipoamide acyltransferase (E2) component
MSTKTQKQQAKEYSIRLPQLFQQMTEPDAVTILKWHVKEQDILRPGAPLLSTETCIGYIDIPAPPRQMMRGAHRVIRIVEPEGATVYLNDLLIVLQAIDSGAA